VRSALSAYLMPLAPSARAVSVETRFEGCEWSFLCYLDIETHAAW
jgi:hypothetical protein